MRHCHNKREVFVNCAFIIYWQKYVETNWWNLVFTQLYKHSKWLQKKCGQKDLLVKVGNSLIVHWFSKKKKFMPGTKLTFQDNKSSVKSDYYSEINCKIYKACFFVCCINLKAPSLWSLNPSYHFSITN